MLLLPGQEHRRKKGWRRMGESLQISLVVLGVLVVGVVYVFNLYQDRMARRRLESAFSPKQPGQPDAAAANQVVSIQESLADGIPLRGVPTATAQVPASQASQPAAAQPFFPANEPATHSAQHASASSAASQMQA